MFLAAPDVTTEKLPLASGRYVYVVGHVTRVTIVTVGPGKPSGSGCCIVIDTGPSQFHNIQVLILNFTYISMAFLLLIY